MGRFWLRKRGFWALFLLFCGLFAFSRPQAAVPAEGEALIEAPLVALTFDDGPRRSTTADLLDGLQERGVPATFFLIGEQIEGNEDLIKRMEEEGHQIGIHSYEHRWLTALSAADFARQVDRERQLLYEILGREDFLLRPPYGGVDAAVEKRANTPIVLWSVDPEDWKDNNIDRIVACVVEQASDGDIILLHDLFPNSAQAALRIVDALLAKGYCFVTVEQLMEERGVVPEAGVRYRKIN